MNWLSEVVACHVGKPASQIGFLAFCIAWWALGWDMLTLTTILSVLAITLSQMILRSQERDSAALKLQMAETIKALPNARDELANADKLSLPEIENLRD